jgi:hypothetical protein
MPIAPAFFAPELAGVFGTNLAKMLATTLAKRVAGVFDSEIGKPHRRKSKPQIGRCFRHQNPADSGHR